MIQLSVGLGLPSSWIMAIITLIFGILVLVFPGFLRWIIGGYLVIMGLIGIVAYLI